jgi:hypothetical protein
MTAPTIFTVTPDDLSRLDAESAVDLIAQLLWAESMRIGLAISSVRITTKVTAKDGGIDATIDDSDEVAFDDSFLWTDRMGLQIKAGSSFSPTEAAIRKELFGDQSPTKEALAPAVRDCMDADGVYILVCVGDDPTDDKVQEAEEHLETFFKACGYPEPYVEVWGQNQLIGFLKRFPSIALWVNGKAGALFQTHSSWAAQIEMRRVFKPGDPQNEFITSVQEQLRRHDATAKVLQRYGISSGQEGRVSSLFRYTTTSTSRQVAQW